mmetsp:Transcript_82630/g.260966  ORF Transcript_82630/g.260966 Transcript_82630/m.260966 type:complete len:244 (+) Transcript_82630:412-1143(+)
MNWRACSASRGFSLIPPRQVTTWSPVSSTRSSPASDAPDNRSSRASAFASAIRRTSRSASPAARSPMAFSSMLGTRTSKSAPAAARIARRGMLEEPRTKRGASGGSLRAAASAASCVAMAGWLGGGCGSTPMVSAPSAPMTTLATRRRAPSRGQTATAAPAAWQRAPPRTARRRLPAQSAAAATARGAGVEAPRPLGGQELRRSHAGGGDRSRRPQAAAAGTGLRKQRQRRPSPWRPIPPRPF